LPGCSVAAGVTLNGNRSIGTLGAVGPQGNALFEGQALLAAYRAMRERATQTAPFQADQPDGSQLISTPIAGRDRVPFGILQVLTENQLADARVQATLEALTAVVADSVQYSRLNRELQHSLNQLFLVYEVGRLFNLATSLDDVLLQVRDQL